MLWLALRLPLLPLEACPQAPPSAVIAHERIVACDAIALQGGVVPGMRLADAWALLPALSVRERDAGREAALLESLACWAGGFTSEVCLDPPAVLLLEVRGSLRLFGGLDALLDRIVAAASGLGHVVRVAIAPTPLAARWLATVPDDAVRPRCLSLSGLAATLGPLPLDALELPDARMRRLAGFGVRSVGDLLRLPRAGLARRLGAGFADMLARALGERPDPRVRFRFPEHFRQAIELPAAIEDASRLLFVARRLVLCLCGWLAERMGGVTVCEFRLSHVRTATTILRLELATPTRDAERIGRVLRERLERLILAAPVVRIELLAAHCEALPGRSGGLFGDAATGEGVPQLVERLQARLGPDNVRGLAVGIGHRPEVASLLVAPDEGRGRSGLAPRPCWLLPQPQALREECGRPQHHGPLTLLAGPERIESGWWDEGENDAVGDVRRDYFIAISSRHEWLWIFRCPEGWFLHGFYA